jgi:uncharacterized protein YgiM (DUF1202 family)
VRPSLISIPRVLIFVVALFFLNGCSTIDRLIHPSSKSSSPAEPAAETVQKEESTAKVKPEPPVAAPAEKSPPPLPPSAPAPPPKSPKPAPAPALRVTQIVWSAVNLREGPGMNYKVVGNAKKGTSLGVLEDKGQWLHVRLEDGKEVWVFRSATSLAPQTPPASPAPKPKPM